MLGEIPVSKERRAFLLRHNPWARFEIPSELEPKDYRHYIAHILANFVLWANPEKNKVASETIGYGDGHWNDEPSGIELLWIKDQYFLQSKMCLYDGQEAQSSLGSPGLSKGILFYDHADESSRYPNAVKVFLISDAFEEYLKEHRVEYVRYNWEWQKRGAEEAASFVALVTRGLNPLDHDYLNGLRSLTQCQQTRILAAKRKEYTNDEVALQQINAYDGTS